MNISLVKVGDTVKGWPVLVNGEVVKKFGAVKEGKVVSIVKKGFNGVIVSTHDYVIIEKPWGEREMLTVRQIASIESN